MAIGLSRLNALDIISGGTFSFSIGINQGAAQHRSADFSNGNYIIYNFLLHWFLGIIFKSFWLFGRAG